MKYLGDSLVGLRYEREDNILVILPTGDPTFLNPEFKNQKVFDFLVNEKNVLLGEEPTKKTWKSQPYGKGWAWDDFNESYMTERSCFPIYNNLVRIELTEDGLKFKLSNINYTENNLIVTPAFFKDHIYNPDTIIDNKKFFIQKDAGRGFFHILPSGSDFSRQTIPFKTSAFLSMQLLGDTLLNYQAIKMHYSAGNKAELNKIFNYKYGDLADSNDEKIKHLNITQTIHSQPTDSLFKPMMHRSDNFFAEQTLLMASNERLGYMDDAAIIDTLLKSDMKNVPQRPKWVDGSGLSRYNLFTPQSFIYILDKLKTEFGWNRIKNILPTGGEGTLKSWYLKDSGFIYAKTGTLSNHCALSGYLITNKGKFLIFSILANHYQTGATPIRKAVERFLEAIKTSY